MFPILPTTAEQLKNAVLYESIKGLKINRFTDNFDARRFNYDGVDRSMTFDVHMRIFWLSWFYENFESLFLVFSLLKTERSKRLLLIICAYRIADHHSIRIPVRFDERGIEFEFFSDLEENSADSSFPIIGAFGQLKHFDFNYRGKRYIADCKSLRAPLFRGQYFFEDGEFHVKPEESDFVVDAGACFGDTAVVFGKAVGSNGKVFAFDPVEDHLKISKLNAEQNPDCNIQVMPFGLGDTESNTDPIKLGTYSPGFRSDSNEVPLRYLDGLVISGLIPKVDFIKMDIEGAELAALKGATGSIRKFRPKLAISLYHKHNDLFEIPLYIANEFPFYEMYLEHYSIHNEETVLYCKESKATGE